LIYLIIILIIVLIVGGIIYFIVLKRSQKLMPEQPILKERVMEDVIRDLTASTTGRVRVPGKTIQNLSTFQEEEDEQKKPKEIPEDVIQNLTAPE
jgi:uncharacterized protein YneF (UPF0154 family)